ncbi:MAG TPA: hypothetical protein PKL83_06460, partial [bacterium]|nr:hypothetical protein [bacterium]
TVISTDPISSDGSRITVSLSSMAPNTTQTVSFQVRAGDNNTTTDATISNTATISSTETGTMTTNTVTTILNGTAAQPGTTGNQNVILIFILTFGLISILYISGTVLKKKFLHQSFHE